MQIRNAFRCSKSEAIPVPMYSIPNCHVVVHVKTYQTNSFLIKFVLFASQDLDLRSRVQILRVQNKIKAT